MKRILMLLYMAAVFLAINGCNGGNGKKQPTGGGLTDFKKESLSYDLTTVSPTFTNVYVDASGSMKGYFSLQSDGRFITALSNARYDKLMWMDKSFTSITKSVSEIPTNNLLTKRFSIGESRFDTMISNIIQKDSLGKSDGLSLLFTDGIMSASVKETGIDPGFMKKSFGVFQNFVENVFTNNPGVAAAIFKLDSKYVGTYWNYQNKTVNGVDIQDRPFYVMAFGRPAVIRHFVANNKLGAVLYETFGLYPESERNASSSVYVFTPKDVRNWNGTILTGETIDFYLSVPQYIADMGNDCIKSNLRILLDGEDVTESMKSCVDNLNGTYLNFTGWNVKTGRPKVVTPGTHTLQLRIMKPVSPVWNGLYSEDDTLIKQDFIEQSKTFALQYLVKGFRAGLENEETVLFQTSITFNK